MIGIAGIGSGYGFEVALLTPGRADQDIGTNRYKLSLLSRVGEGAEVVVEVPVA